MSGEITKCKQYLNAICRTYGTDFPASYTFSTDMLSLAGQYFWWLIARFFGIVADIDGYVKLIMFLHYELNDWAYSDKSILAKKAAFKAYK